MELASGSLGWQVPACGFLKTSVKSEMPPQASTSLPATIDKFAKEEVETLTPNHSKP